jgi:signal transduction histidine kinase
MNADKSGSILEEERKIFGMTHPEAGYLIAEKWRLPKEIASAIDHHHFYGRQEISNLDGIILLAVALNREILPLGQSYIEDKIIKISVLSEKLHIADNQLSDIAKSIPKEVTSFALATEIEIEDIETVLARANQELFSTYMSIQRLFKERQELTRKILDEERERGLLEAKQVAISTLSHYVNNASMAISGNAQVIRMSLKHKTPREIVDMLPRMLDIVDNSVHKIVAVLEEISELNSLDSIEFYDQSKILNIDDRLERRLAKIKNDTGIMLPQDVEKDIEDLAS